MTPLAELAVVDEARQHIDRIEALVADTDDMQRAA